MNTLGIIICKILLSLLSIWVGGSFLWVASAMATGWRVPVGWALGIFFCALAAALSCPLIWGCVRALKAKFGMGGPERGVLG